MALIKQERSSRTPDGWRLATVEEARYNLQWIKQSNLLDEWDRARLLNGWIGGSAYDFKVEEAFRSCLGYMLLIETPTPEIFNTDDRSMALYSEVHQLSKDGRSAAFLLCSQDWNEEVLKCLRSGEREEDRAISLWEGVGPKVASKVVSAVARECQGLHSKVRMPRTETPLASLKAMMNMFTGIIEGWVEEAEESLKGFKVEIQESAEGKITNEIVDEFFEDFSQMGEGILDYLGLADVLKEFKDNGLDTSEVFADKFCYVLRETMSLIIHPLCSKLYEQVVMHSEADDDIRSLASLPFYAYQIFNEILEGLRRVVKEAAKGANGDCKRFGEILCDKGTSTLGCKGEFDALSIILVQKAENGEVNNVKRLIEIGAHLSTTDCEGKTALHYAAELEDESNGIEIAKMLLAATKEKESLVNKGDSEMTTPLHTAVQEGHVEMCKLLLQNKARVTSPDEDGKTALHYAAELEDESNGIEIAKMLLAATKEKESLVNKGDSEMKTPLHTAVQEGHVEMCKLLLQDKASVTARDEDGWTPLHYAFWTVEPNEEVLRLLISADRVEGSPPLVDIEDNEGKTPLDRALNSSAPVNMVVWLLSLSIHPESYFKKLELPLYLRESSRVGYVDLVQKLLDGGADPFQGDYEGKTSLHYAAEGADEDVALKIIEKLLSDKKQESPKWRKASVGDKYGRNVLHISAFLGRKRLCRWLLDLDRKMIDTKDRDGQSAIFYAVAGPHQDPDVLNEFISRKQATNQAFVKDFSQTTPLHVAAARGNLQMLKKLLTDISEQERKIDYVEATDVLGQTALHKAASGGHCEVVEMLLKILAHPLKQRDCDGKTALHFAAQADGEKAVKVAELLLKNCKSDEQRSLLLFASAVGIGKSNPLLENYLEQEKSKIQKKLDQVTLIQVAARLGDTDMTREFIARGADIALICNEKWKQSLTTDEEKNNVNEVLKQLDNIVEQGADKPALRDTLGRSPFATGLAALFLNPFVKSPVTVGISGEWGMGKSSVMLQTESILLQTAAQLAFTKSFQKDNFIGAGESKLSKTGQARRRKIAYAIERLHDVKGNGPNIIHNIGTCIKRVKDFTAKVLKIVLQRSKYIKERRKKQVTQQKDLKYPSKVTEPQHFSKSCKFWNAIRALWTKTENLNEFNDFLGNYQPKYHYFFKSLAIMDQRNMFKKEEGSGSENQIVSEMPWDEDSIQGITPSILTVRYNAWHYRNESEAWAGLAVEITKELEATMNVAHKLRTSWIYNWRNRKNSICFGVILPCFLALLVAVWFTTVIWLLLDTAQNKDIKKFKYGGVPASMIITAWGVGKSVLSFVKPISSQVVDYICLPDHSQKLGYHQKVIDDINFLKEQLSYRPSWVSKMFAFIWCCITFSRDENYVPGTMIRKMPPAFSNNLRIIVFVDDLDRCEENVILQVLSAVNLVLAACQINVILSMDNSMIQRAIIRKYGKGNSRPTKFDEDLADKYLRKIIQLPLPLPDPSDKESNDFLQSQLGMWDSRKGSPDPGAERERYSSSGRRKENPKFQINSSVTSGTSVSKKPKLGRRESLKFFAETGAKQQRALSFSVTAQKELGKTEDQEAIGKPEGSVIEEATIEIDETQQETGETEKQETSKQSDEQGQREGSNCERSPMDLSLITSAMLIPKYSIGERNAFRFLHSQSTRSRKNPREWKCLMAYHRLAWNILSLTTDVVPVEGWQVQLIAWIFVCWHWRHLMTTLIKKWKNLEVLKKWKAVEESSGPSLREIVEHYIDERWPADKRKENTSEKKDDAAKEVEKKSPQKNATNSSEETKENDDAIDRPKENMNDNSSSSTKEVDTTTENLPQENTTFFSAEYTEGDDYLKEVLRKVLKEQEELREIVRKSLREQEEMREFLRKSLKEQEEKQEEMREMIKKKVLKEDKDDKGEISMQQGTRAKENQTITIKTIFAREEDNEGDSSLQQYTTAEENQKTQKEKDEEELEEWNELRDTLRSYNVSMDGIQAFQKFRFYCEPGYLPWPLPKQS